MPTPILTRCRKLLVIIHLIVTPAKKTAAIIRQIRAPQIAAGDSPSKFTAIPTIPRTKLPIVRSFESIVLDLGANRHSSRAFDAWGPPGPARLSHHRREHRHPKSATRDDGRARVGGRDESAKGAAKIGTEIDVYASPISQTKIGNHGEGETEEHKESERAPRSRYVNAPSLRRNVIGGDVGHRHPCVYSIVPEIWGGDRPNEGSPAPAGFFMPALRSDIGQMLDTPA
jgi:hypothetical protein